MYYLMTKQPGMMWRLSGEGPWHLLDDAREFASAEVGAEWKIVDDTLRQVARGDGTGCTSTKRVFVCAHAADKNGSTDALYDVCECSTFEEVGKAVAKLGWDKIFFGDDIDASEIQITLFAKNPDVDV